MKKVESQSHSEFIDNIYSLIESGNLHSAIQTLLISSSVHRIDKVEIRSLLSRLNRYEKEINLGIVNDNNEINKITFSLLNIVENLHVNKSDRVGAFKSEMIQFIIPVIIVLIGIFFIMWIDENKVIYEDQENKFGAEESVENNGNASVDNKEIVITNSDTKILDTENIVNDSKSKYNNMRKVSQNSLSSDYENKKQNLDKGKEQIVNNDTDPMIKNNITNEFIVIINKQEEKYNLYVDGKLFLSKGTSRLIRLSNQLLDKEVEFILTFDKDTCSKVTYLDLSSPEIFINCN